LITTTTPSTATDDPADGGPGVVLVAGVRVLLGWVVRDKSETSLKGDTEPATRMRSAK
jgi:hypothetical protein